jgi:DNA-binding transcriptional LysR family regulator
MKLKSRQPDAKSQQPKPQSTNAVSWDDLRIFLSCSENSSFRAASKELRLNSATVVRRIDRLEQAMGVRLFYRLAEGVQLTDDGNRIAKDARDMQRASFNIARKSQIHGNSLRGVVRIAVTEGIGTYWLLPRLLSFQQANRLLTIEMISTMTYSDVGKLESDISINFTRPESPDLIAVRLGYLHIHGFASVNYIQKYGFPRDVSELSGHRIIQQSAPLLDESAYARQIGVESVEGIVGFRTNSSAAVLYAIERDAGIGFLPTYASVLGERLVPIDIGGARYRLEIWMTYHPNLRGSPRHMTVVDWLRRVFDYRRFPCFGEEFVHPSELVQQMREAKETSSGEGYAAAFPLSEDMAES